MQRRSALARVLPIAVLAILALSLVPSGFRFAFGYQVAQNANIVVGQADFVSNVNPTTSLRLPSNLAYDSSGNFWIADSGNNRVVETPNLVAGGNQQFLDVLGQSGYSIGSPSVTASGLDNPSGMTTDSSGNLWVTDTNNNRILEYPKPFSAPGEGASIVIGQVNPFASAAATTQTGLHFPGDQVFDSTGNLWVADTGNNRILEFKAPFAAGMSASAVLGQAVYTTSASVTSASGLYFPTDAIFDSSGNMWVADGGNNRILEYKAPLATDMNASLVIGQANFNTNASAATQAGLNLPESLAFDSTGNLWVADTFNNRVLEYKAPFSNGMEATTVLGQPDFTSSAPAISKTGLHSPAEVVFNPSGSLWVADADNNRLVEFTTPFANGNGASLVFGQSTYTSSLSQGQQSLYQPQAVTSDSSGNLWVTDAQNNRVVEYKAPLANGMSASLAIGQANLTRDLGSTTRSGLTTPFMALFDKSGDLWVSDFGNNRILEFTPPFSTGMNATLVLGQASFTTGDAADTQTGFYAPSGMAFDASGNLWVADTDNSRVLEFTAPFTSDMGASLVLGQLSFVSASSGTSASQMTGPTGVAFDSAGDLWVADAFNNRVVAFAPPFSTGQRSTLEIGQPNFSSFTPTTAQSGFYVPESLAFDPSGSLWVSDTGNNRVLGFTPHFSSGMNASTVIGQGNFTSRVAATTSTGLTNPGALTFDASGNMWLADISNNRVLAFIGTSSSTTTTSQTSTSSTSSSSSSSTSSTSSSSTTSTSSSLSTSTTSSSTTSSSSTVPEFPLGAPAVLVTLLFVVAFAFSARSRRSLD